MALSQTVDVYGAYFLQFVKRRLAYKWDLLADILANVVVTGLGLLFVTFLLDGEVVKNLRGWTREEVLFIYGYAMISMALFQTLGPNLYGFGNRYIIQGQFDRVLLRPLNSLAQVIFESFNIEAVGSLAVGVIVLWSSTEALGIDFGLLDWLWFALSCLSGAVILLSFFIILTSLSFHFEDRVGIVPPFYNMIAFGRYPLPIFNGVLQFVLRWLVPFAFVAFYPATHFLGRSEYAFFCYLSPVMAAIFAFLAIWAWNAGVKQYGSVGN